MGEPSHEIPSVGATNWSAGVTAARHLAELGHRRIAVISGPTDYLCARARLEACRAALDTAGGAAGRPAGAQRVLPVRRRAAVRRGTAAAARPTAILCGNDLQALGVYEAARRAGLRIPSDLSVVGFDDIPAARWSPPPLTTVRQPFADMGETAAHVLLALVSGKPAARNRVELSTTLVVRESTAPPPSRSRKK
jgi:LacI family transcriptional regulator, xylobiose transport system transcriptional regulator